MRLDAACAGGNDVVPLAALFDPRACATVVSRAVNAVTKRRQAMYYHPSMFDWANGERTLVACRAFVAVWLDGVARQHKAHADAVSAFHARRLDSLQMLCEASDSAQFAARLVSCAVAQPFDLAELSARLGGIAVDTQRRLGDLVGSHADEVARLLADAGGAADKPRRDASNGRGTAARRRLAA
jgi:hypothetical protein